MTPIYRTYSKALLALVLLLPFQLSHADDVQETSVNEAETAIVETEALKPKDVEQLVTQLNDYVLTHPEDRRVWETLAQTYYQYGYSEDAVYAAGEAAVLGSEEPYIKQILLLDSVALAKSQIQEGYSIGLTDSDAAFLKEYQHALSKTYGDIYGFNYDESLPKKRIVRKKYSQPRRTTSKKVTRPTPRKATRTTVKRPAKQVTAPRRATRSAPRVSSSPRDPFDVVR